MYVSVCVCIDHVFVCVCMCVCVYIYNEHTPIEIYKFLRNFKISIMVLWFIMSAGRNSLMIRFLYLKGCRPYYVLLQHPTGLRNGVTLNTLSLYQPILLAFASMLAYSIDAGARTTWILIKAE